MTKLEELQRDASVLGPHPKKDLPKGTVAGLLRQAGIERKEK